MTDADVHKVTVYCFLSENGRLPAGGRGLDNPLKYGLELIH